MKSLCGLFDNIIFFDVETTGIDSTNDEIIEFAALRAECKQEHLNIEEKVSFLVKLSPGRYLPSIITKLTGITGKRLEDTGISKEEACGRIEDILNHRNCLLVAYNAHFDLCFMYYFLGHFNKASLLKNVKMLDALTIYKD